MQREGVVQRIPWWPYLLGGIALVVFGILAIVWPDITVTVFVIAFGAVVLVEGVFMSAGALVSREDQTLRWFLLLTGVVSIVIGVLILIWPNITAQVVLYIIATWAVLSGLMKMVTGIFWPQQRGADRWLLMLGGVVAIIFGILLFAWPVAGALAITWLIGLFAIILGIMLTIEAFEVLGTNRQLTKGAS